MKNTRQEMVSPDQFLTNHHLSDPFRHQMASLFLYTYTDYSKEWLIDEKTG